MTGAEAAATSAQAGTTAEKARVGHAAGTVQADADAAAIDAAPPPSPPSAISTLADTSLHIAARQCLICHLICLHLRRPIPTVLLLYALLAGISNDL